MTISTQLTFEFISSGPATPNWSSSSSVKAHLEAATERWVEEMQLKAAIERLTATEERRKFRRIRKSKPVLIVEGCGSLTLAEVAARLRVNRRTVERYISDGTLKAARIGGKGPYRITEEDFQSLLVGNGMEAEQDVNLDDFISDKIMIKSKA